MYRFRRLLFLAFICSVCASAQKISHAGTPTRIVITTGHFYGAVPPAITAKDLILTQNYEPRPITNLVPLRGDRANLEVFLLVDNASNCDARSLRRFIGSQPPTTAIGVAYIEEGRLSVAEKPTQNRERAIEALRIPAGSKGAAPFAALEGLIKVWNPDSARHVMLMISNGIDSGREGALVASSAEAALEAAQRNSVTVYAIYHPSVDYATSSLSVIRSGQVQLSHIAIETGGEAYFQGFAPLHSFGPFLTDLAEHLASQYLLEFIARPVVGIGSLQDVMVKSKVHDVEVAAPSRVWIAGLRSTDYTLEAARRRQ